LGAYRVVDGSEDVGLWKHAAELQKDSLGAAQIEQEVVNQGDPEALGCWDLIHQSSTLPAEATRSEM
jgi:hypothetical protein